MLNKGKKADEGWYWTTHSAHPYIGCEHACEYCYARSDRYLHFDDAENYSRVIKVKVNAPQILKKELSRIKEKAVIALGDYQPAEEKYELSRRMLEVVRDLNFPIHIIEKSDLLLRDIDILKEINKKTWCCVSYSLSTVDEKIAKLFEPHAPSPKSRLKAVKKISEAGILTGVSYMPIIPYITDSEEKIEEVISSAKNNKAHYVLAASMTLEGNQKERFFGLLEKRYPDVVKKYRELYSDNSWSPPSQYQKELYKKVNRFCEKYKIANRIPKPDLEKYYGKIVQKKLHDWQS